jgi:predicted house-cleaning noncanonical NTP pyrophosphatase (MazG superfamily)
MKKAWAEIERLIAVNARHRKGFNIADAKPLFILAQANDELNELLESPANPDELADTLGVLFHYAIKKGWTMEFLEKLMLNKFKERFAECKHERLNEEGICRTCGEDCRGIHS